MLAYCVRNTCSAQMLELIHPMGSVLLSWLLLFLLFSGAGLLVMRAIGQPVTTGWIWLDSFWLGWALVLGAMQVWHLAFPVDETLLLLLAAVAALTLFSCRRRLGLILVRLARHRAFLLVFALLALWMSNRALGMPIAFDTGYRDIQIVLWIDAYPIVPGLGNLFSSFAFNHSVYLYDALLDAAIWSGRSYHIATGLLLLVYLAFALNAALEVFRSRAGEGLRWSRLFAALTIPLFLFQTVGYSGISHFLTDTVIELIGFLTVIHLLDFLQYWRAGSRSHDYLVYRLALIILTGFTVKQSFAVFGLATAAVALGIWLRRGGLGAGAGRMPRLVVADMSGGAGALAAVDGAGRHHQRIRGFSAINWQIRAGLDDTGGGDRNATDEAGDEYARPRRRSVSGFGILELAGSLAGRIREQRLLQRAADRPVARRARLLRRREPQPQTRRARVALELVALRADGGYAGLLVCLRAKPEVRPLRLLGLGRAVHHEGGAGLSLGCLAAPAAGPRRCAAALPGLRRFPGRQAGRHIAPGGT